MATGTELVNSRTYSGTTGESDFTQTRSFKIEGTDSDATAFAQVLTTSPSTVTANSITLYRDAISLDPEWVDETGADGLWFADVSYITAEAISVRQRVTERDKQDGETPPEEEKPELEIRYQVNAVSTRRLYSLQTVISEPASAKDNNGAIEIDESGINGVDIEFGALTFTIKKTYSKASFDSSRSDWALAAFQVNNASYNGFSAGEVLYRGFTAEPNNDWDPQTSTLTEQYDVTFSFAVSPNGAPSISDASLPDTVTSTDFLAKKGWNYFWILRDRQNPNSDPLQVTAIGAYVEKVYGETGFVADVGLPNPS